MRFLDLHFHTNGKAVAVNAFMVVYVHPIVMGAHEGSEILLQGRPAGETLKVAESVQEVLKKIASVTGDYAIK